MRKKLIGITGCEKFQFYQNWVTMGSKDVGVFRFEPRKFQLEDVDKCDGIIFSGGEDVYPQMYDAPENLIYTDQNSYNRDRDQMERDILKYSTNQKKIPILGICRGTQLINVCLGGSLWGDIPKQIGSILHGKSNGDDSTHSVSIEENSMLFSIIQQNQVIVNSSHHQSVNRIAESLQVVAKSIDGINEALEWKNQEEKNWMLLLQWHPERMMQLNQIVSTAILNAFLKAVAISQEGKTS